MPLFSRAKESILVGLALHHDRLSIIKVRQSKLRKSQHYTLEAFALADAPSGWLSDGKINHAEDVVRIIRELVARIQAKNCYAVIGLSSSSVISKRIRLAACLSDAEREADVMGNLNHYFPGMNESLNFDYGHLEKRDQEDELLLIAARREQINAYVDITERAELKVRVVDVDVYALLRVMMLSESSEPVVILDVDITAAQLILIDRANVASVHQILMSEDDDSLVQQLRRGIQLFCAAMQLTHIEKIILTGKRECLDRVRKLLGDELFIQAEQSHLFQQVNLSESVNRDLLCLNEPELLVAFGLALRSFPQW